MIHFGVVEKRTGDKTRNMRYKVRVLGVHHPLKSELPTDDLPWAVAIQNNSAAMSGIGDSPNGYLQGTTVAVIFADKDNQIPLILGAVAGIGSSAVDGDTLFYSINSDISIIPPTQAPKLPSDAYIGTLTLSQVRQLVNRVAVLRGNNQNKITEHGIGRYGHTTPELMALGYVDNTETWLGKNGITSREKYLASPTEQTTVEEELLKLYYTSLAQLGIVSGLTKPEKLGGLLVACHVDGELPVFQLIESGTDYTNIIGESVINFYKEGFKQLTGVITSELPTLENLSKTASDMATDTNVSKSKYDVKADEKTQSNQGFRDVDSQYPLPSHDNEPDSPRLATGIKVSETILGLKERTSVNHVPVALSSVSWKQSPQPYNARYPYNKVKQTESGHVLEFDDTPGYERVHIAHRTGTFEEIDHEGNKVDRTVGIRTIIVDKDELVYIKGSGHVCIDGDLSLRVKNAINVEILGNANIKTTGDFNLEVGGKFSLSAGSIDLQSKGTFAVGGSGGIIKGLIGNMGVPIVLEQGTTMSVPSYNPTISIPAPITRKELQGIELEDTTASKILAGPTKPVKKNREDKTPPKVNPTPIVSVFGLPDEITYSTQLSTNFRIRDVAVGNIGSNFPFAGQHGLTAKQIASNLRDLCLNVLEPIKEHFKSDGWVLTSCIRPAGNPHSIPGRISQHEMGQAADMVFMMMRGKQNTKDLFFEAAVWIKDNILYDQLLLEYRGDTVWIHVSYNRNGNRRKVLTMNNDSVYDTGLILLE